MSCLQVDINIVPLALTAEAKRFETPLSVEVIDLFKGHYLKLTCGIVCGIKEVHYLRVSPHEVQWITPDEAVIYIVESNTNWTIVNS